ncbi:hypothetical protein BHM03_00030112 [Ensete ventricosum]|nr:hypothetical protein BHM03_00030112 [Ensete ventricosum]
MLSFRLRSARLAHRLFDSLDGGYDIHSIRSIGCGNLDPDQCYTIGAFKLSNSSIFKTLSLPVQGVKIGTNRPLKSNELGLQLKARGGMDHPLEVRKVRDSSTILGRVLKEMDDFVMRVVERDSMANEANWL